jgi:hypothetical protein
MSKFKPGQSGNPGGRPKAVMELQQAAREHTKEAVERLVFWTKSDHPAASPMAAKELLDRGWGRPQQTMNVRKIRDITDLDDTELAILAGVEIEGDDEDALH